MRLENEGHLSRTIGRSSTDALLGGAVLELARTLDDRMVRGDVDEIVVMLSEDQLPTLARVAAEIGVEGRLVLGSPVPSEVSVRWGAKIAEPRETDPDLLLAGARAALERAHAAAEPGAIDRTPKTAAAP